MFSVGVNIELMRYELMSSVPYLRLVSNSLPGAKSVVPFCSSVAPATRSAHLSVIGTLTMPRNPSSESEPDASSPEASKPLASGFAVCSAIAPPVELRPNSVPCGPRRISMRSRS